MRSPNLEHTGTASEQFDAGLEALRATLSTQCEALAADAKAELEVAHRAQHKEARWRRLRRTASL